MFFSCNLKGKKEKIIEFQDKKKKKTTKNDEKIEINGYKVRFVRNKSKSNEIKGEWYKSVFIYIKLNEI